MASGHSQFNRKPPASAQMSFASVSPERSGWRDESLSERHRLWGLGCPAVDLDFVLLEYDRGKATAIVEYKNENAPLQYPASPGVRALVDLGDRASLPVFGVRYSLSFEWFCVAPLNRIAKARLSKRTTMSEREWVRTLYALRGHALPAGLFDREEPIAV